LLTAGEAHPDAGILAPRLIAPDGSTQHSVHPFPTLALTLAFNLGIATLKGDRLALNGHWNPETARHVDWALGAFVLVRRTVWDQIHGFAPEQWMYAEDLDLAWRAAHAGWGTWYDRRRGHARRRGVDLQAWGETGPERWLKSTYGWMIRRRGPLITRTYALLNTAGATARLILAGRNTADRAVDADVGALHARALVTRAADLRSQR